MSDTTLNTSETFAPVAESAPRTADGRWSAGRTFRFVVYSSLLLWSLIAAAVVSLI